MKRFTFCILALAAVALFASDASAHGKVIVGSRFGGYSGGFSRVGSFGGYGRSFSSFGYGYSRPIVVGSSYGYGSYCPPIVAAPYCPPVVTFAQPYCPPVVGAPCYPATGFGGYGAGFGGYGTVGGGYGYPATGGIFRGY